MRSGMLSVIRKGVVLVGGGEPSEWHQVVAVAKLVPHGVVSHWTAARLQQFPVAGPGTIEITVVWPLDSHLDGVIAHRVRTLPDGDIEEKRGVRVTTAARTLVDLAPLLAPGALERLLDEGLVQRWWTVEAVDSRLSSMNRPPELLRQLVRVRAGGKFDVGLEVRAAAALKPAGPFETQHQVVLGREVFVLDIAWPALKVTAECAGWWVRSRSRSKFEKERRKFNLLAADGWTVVHLTPTMSDDDIREAVIPVLLAALGSH